MSDDQHDSIRRKLQAVFDQEPWMKPEALGRKVHRIVVDNASYRSRRTRLVTLADHFNAALAPQTACGAGCNGCCSMPTMIYQHEAAAMAEASGRPMAKVPRRTRAQALNTAMKDFGTPCLFLVDSVCSIYEARPLICRLHHSLNPDASACDTRIPLGERTPNAFYDMDLIETPYHKLVAAESLDESWAHIQAFFPL